jgi:diguanylate cyclase (GGDEF)-like protein
MTTPSSATQKQRDVAHDGYMPQLRDRVQELEVCWDKICAGEWSWDHLASLRHQAHILAESASFLGTSTVTATLQQLVQILTHMEAIPPDAPAPKMRADIDTLFTSLTAAVQASESDSHIRPSLDSSAVAERSEHESIVLIVENDSAAADHMTVQLEHFGYHAIVVPTLDGVADAVRTHPPVAIVLDILLPKGVLADPQQMREMIRVEGNPPVIFLSQRNDFEARLWAVRAGGRAYLTKPVDVDRLVSVLDTLTGAFIPEPFRVLIVDDTRMMSTLYEAMLRDAGMLTVALNNPTQIIQMLNEFQPDLLLLDMYMPTCTGTEVATLIRQQAAFISLPIVFLSGEQDRDHQLAALNHGGDDFLTKPITAAQLVSAVTSRIHRARAMRAQLSQDGLTGLLTHVSIKEQVIREMVRAQRYGTALTLAMIDIDHFKRINDTYGHAAGDRVLKGLSRLLHQRLRRSDSIGRYGGEEFLIIMPQTDGPTAFHVIDDIRVRFATIGHQLGNGDKETTVTFSGGVACLCPAHHDGSHLLEAADTALYAAKHAGRNQIMLEGSCDGNTPSHHC